MEYGGKVSIECEKTGYRAELEFKLKPWLGSGEASNRVTGKIKLGSETLATLDGKWDQEITLKEKNSGVRFITTPFLQKITLWCVKKLKFFSVRFRCGIRHRK